MDRQVREESNYCFNKRGTPWYSTLGSAVDPTLTRIIFYASPYRLYGVSRSEEVVVHRWNLEASVIAGMEFYRSSTRRRLRLYLTYYHGFNPYGQFFISQKIESVGAGLSLAF
jgi:hypothetical protein